MSQKNCHMAQNYSQWVSDLVKHTHIYMFVCMPPEQIFQFDMTVVDTVICLGKLKPFMVNLWACFPCHLVLRVPFGVWLLWWCGIKLLHYISYVAENQIGEYLKTRCWCGICSEKYERFEKEILVIMINNIINFTRYIYLYNYCY